MEICSEFEVEKTELPAGTEYNPEVRTCCFILIVMSGECLITANNENDVVTTCSQGHVFFIAAGTSLVVTALSEDVVYYKAHVNMENL